MLLILYCDLREPWNLHTDSYRLLLLLVDHRYVLECSWRAIALVTSKIMSSIKVPRRRKSLIQCTLPGRLVFLILCSQFVVEAQSAVIRFWNEKVFVRS